MLKLGINKNKEMKMSEYTLHVDLNKREAKMLLPFVAAEGNDVHILSEMVKDTDKFVVETQGKKSKMSIWYDFGDMIPDKVWGGLGLADMISMIDKPYADSLCKQAVFEYVKAKLIAPTMEALKQSADEWVSNWKSNDA